MTTEINNSWNWIGFSATEVVATNDFGNIIFISDKNEYWRICPEELSCEKIASDKDGFNRIWNDSEFSADWAMADLVEIAKDELGELKEGEKFCLKIPGVLGGNYEKSNIGKISFIELIKFSGDLGNQISTLKDGEQVTLKIIK